MKKYKIDNVSNEKIKSAVSAIVNNGGKVYTDNSFQIMGVKGDFELNDHVLTIKIYYKPFLTSWEMLENELYNLFCKSNKNI
jgi:hypothetical protein